MIEGLIFIGLTAVSAHLLFSRFGFNPTDDGFILAGSRRIINGQMPHKDFISIRLALSHVLHIPELWIGKSYALIISRFIFWIELAVISWSITGIFGLSMPYVWGVICFCLMANCFPMMAWHTVDAILFSILAVVLMPTPAGFFLLGLAPLCRQNFYLILPVFYVLFPVTEAFLSLVPTFLYFAVIWFSKGLGDLRDQLSAHQFETMLKVGLYHYLNLLLVAGFLTGLVVTLYHLVWMIPVIVSFLFLLIAIRKKSDYSAYFIFGYTLTALVLQPSSVLVIIVVIAWISSLSIGFPYPALMMGPLLCVASSRLEFTPVCLGVIAFVSCFGIVFLRCICYYRQPSIQYLTYDLSKVLYGARGIKTNEYVFRYLDDLNKVLAMIGNRPYCLVPDGAAVWMNPSIMNPLPCDWPQETELSKNQLVQRVIDSIKTKPDMIKIVQRYEAKSLGKGLIPLSEKYQVVRFIRENYKLKHETDFFCVFE